MSTRLGVVAALAPLRVRLKGETVDVKVDLVRQGSSGFVVGERVTVEFADRLLVVGRLVAP